MSIHYDRMIETILASLEVGSPIFTADGERIGRLAEVRSQYLKVAAPLRRDYWLDASNVRVCDSQRIELAFDHDDIAAYRADDPGHPKVQSETLGGPHPPDGLVPAGEFPSTAMPMPDGDASNRATADRRASQTDRVVEQKNDLVVSESQQMETRMRMQGGLIDQRGKLDHPHPIGEDGISDTVGTLGEPVEWELTRLEQERAPVGRQTFGVTPRFSPHSSRSRYWLFLASTAALLAVGAAAVLGRRMQPPRRAQMMEKADGFSRANRRRR